MLKNSKCLGTLGVFKRYDLGFKELVCGDKLCVLMCVCMCLSLELQHQYTKLFMVLKISISCLTLRCIISLSF